MVVLPLQLVTSPKIITDVSEWALQKISKFFIHPAVLYPVSFDLSCTLLVRCLLLSILPLPVPSKHAHPSPLPGFVFVAKGFSLVIKVKKAFYSLTGYLTLSC